MSTQLKFNALQQNAHLTGQARPAPALHPAETDLRCLNVLRLTALSCRAKPKMDLFRACALLQNTRSKSLEAHAEALIRCLPEALGAAPRFYRPGTPVLTFDEAWIVRLADAWLRNDEDSRAFLLRSRVLPEHRRQIGFLIARTSAIFQRV